MQLIRSVCEMQTIGTNLGQRARVKLVPTMGALHEGHGSLIELAKTDRAPCFAKHQDDSSNWNTNKSSPINGSAGSDGGDGRRGSLTSGHQDSNNANVVGDSNSTAVVVVSIFINPAQFNDPDDLDSYPKTLESDLGLCERLGVDYVFLPESKDIYPSGSSASSVCMIEPAHYLGSILEGRSRPGHFRGMLTVVNKLINIVQPCEIYFGEKDYQQLVLAHRMVSDLNLRVRVCPAKTFRDLDMLPLSSRNTRLGKMERKLAPIIYTILDDAKQALESTRQLMTGELSIDEVIAASVLATRISRLDPNDETRAKLTIDYIELKCANDLTDVTLCEGVRSQAFDCKLGCATGDNNRGDGGISIGKTRILTCRLLISIIIGGIRLLDNIEVHLSNSHQERKH